MLRVWGCEKGALGVFARQGELFALFAAPQGGGDALRDVLRHWVGEEHSLAAFMQAPGSLAGLPLAADHMLRLESVSTEAEYELLLRPPATGALGTEID